MCIMGVNSAHFFPRFVSEHQIFPHSRPDRNNKGRPERIGTASVAIMEWGFYFVILNGVKDLENTN